MTENTVQMLDTLSRPVRDLRISVTDRCNFRCTYCMPKEVFNSNYEFLHREQLLTFEEITRLARIFASLGVRKVRLTGGEPLLRKNLAVLIEHLAAIDAIEDISLTTNGVLLTQDRARQLRNAGLNRITISLDTLDVATFRSISNADFGPDLVLRAIDEAEAAGLAPVKLNMVVKKGANESSILSMARHFHGSGKIVRFIEYMDVGHTNQWNLDDVYTAAEIVSELRKEFDIEPAEPNYRGEVAKRWRYKDGGGEVGIIASVTQPFCQDCTRARLSAEGKLYTCLFATQGRDLRHLLREGASDKYIAGVVGKVWSKRDDRYSETRTSESPLLPKIEMSYIGG
ncbi:MAG: GTP 3',8-cyclase MoaA [Proteobacteria bacterium]|nr:GTP 3',8-cyclase MoaA [Pseudomonadota bacterium]